jgi:hypothetical protein
MIVISPEPGALRFKRAAPVERDGAALARLPRAVA